MLAALLSVVLTAVAALAAPPSSYAARTATPLSEGIHEGFFYTWWTDNPESQASYTNGGKGNFG
jgi:endo-1,4-beta-xylanase